MKKIISGIVAIVALLLLVMVVNTLLYTPNDGEIVAKAEVTAKGNDLAQQISEAIQFKTISHQPPVPIDPLPFENFIAWLEKPIRWFTKR